MTNQNVRISGETHAAASAHVMANGKKLGRFVDDAIREKIERDEVPTLSRQREKVETHDYSPKKEVK